MTAEHIEQGRALFNAGHFFQAHEVWEEAWLQEDGEIRVLLQGLIQIAAAMLKASRAERPSGCAQLLAAGLEKLALLGPDLAGLDLISLRRSVEEFQTAAALWLEGDAVAPSGRFPQLNRTTGP
jgi:predicted metal-dependent hydrolase